MRWITTNDDFNQMLRRDEVMLYIYVGWSVYSARDGLQIVEQVERSLHEKHSERKLSLFGWRT